MKKTFSFLALAVVAFASCKKSTNNTYVAEPKPAFVVNGLHDITIYNDIPSFAPISYPLALEVTYNDSIQDRVTLSITGLPAGINTDNSWVAAGIPSFSTTINFFDTTVAGTATGTYPVTLTATSSTYGKRAYTFNIIVANRPLVTAPIIGAYPHCSNNGAISYADTISDDPVVANKIWFQNFAGTGKQAYGYYTVNTGGSSGAQIFIPAQKVGSLIVYSGNLFSNVTTPRYFTGSLSSNLGTTYISMN